MSFKKMTAVEKIQELALKTCMITKQRYLDALYSVISNEDTVEFINEKIILSEQDRNEVIKFEANVQSEYQEYRDKMDKAGMK